jgi:hypothetical protein
MPGYSEGRVPSLRVILWHLLCFWRRSTENPLVKVVETYQLGMIHYVDMVTFGIYSRIVCGPGSSLGHFRKPESTLGQRTNLPSWLGVFPRQPTLSRISKLEIWCGPQGLKLPNPREFACCQWTKMHL